MLVLTAYGFAYCGHFSVLSISQLLNTLIILINVILGKQWFMEAFYTFLKFYYMSIMM